ncbi:MAG: SpoIID/LytB domain-containing protein [Microgenomates group bacterium]|jgi:SpoIID/LytB domain protein
MKKIFLFLVILFFSLLTITYTLNPAFADEVSDLQAQIDELSKAREMSVTATKPLEGQLSALKIQLAQIQNKLAVLSANIIQKEKDISIRTDKLVVQQSLLSQRVRSYYIRSYMASPFTVIFTSAASGDLLRELSYRQAATREDQSVISQVTADMLDLITQKDKLEKDKKALASMQVEVDKNAAFIGGEVKKAKDYQTNLTKQIASLTARQQEIIAARIGSLHLSRSAGISMACSDDRNIDPGFSPAFAFYTFGIPHRVGMSQFGAYGRANAGQSYDQILKAYYNFDGYQEFDVTIRVDDSNANIHWSGSLDDYAKRIYEVPGSWPIESLKAQAIAARSYALAYTNKGSGSICASQDCQVFKTDPKGGAWEQAVNETSKKAMVVGGNPIKAWFSSTDGGYTHPSSEVFGGSTSWTKNLKDVNGDINSLADLFSKAYDRDSPCFYNAQGWRPQYNKSAWLKSDEVADIVNVAILSAYTTDWDSWDAEKVKSELRSKGATPFNRIDSISTNFDFGSGRTTSITLSGDAGSKTFDGKVFKDYFNVRAPANIAIVGPLFNIEKR